MLKLENSIRGLSFSRVAFDLTIQDKKITMTHITSRNFMYGAGEGNRTLLSSLGSSHSTDELRPHDVHIVSYINLFIQVQLIILYIYP